MHFDGVCSLSKQGCHAKLALQTLLSLLLIIAKLGCYTAVIQFILMPSPSLLLNV
jgi:hypothetical protein